MYSSLYNRTGVGPTKLCFISLCVLMGMRALSYASNALPERPTLGLGPRLAAQIRSGSTEGRYRFLARGISAEAIKQHGGKVTGRIGPILSGLLSGSAIHLLAPSAGLIEAPQPLRLALDQSRLSSRADLPDRGDGFDRQYRGAGVLVAAYDSGIDLLHPDLRERDGPTRVIALWDQDATGTPPVGQTDGHECDRESLARDTCYSWDHAGHGTHVISIAASNGPQYRGIAPAAAIALARSDTFVLLVPTLDWMRSVAQQHNLPLVVNLSLAGHGGPHDGTSLEAQAIDAFPHLVVAVAGNEGTDPVHASVTLEENNPRFVVLRFPPAAQPDRSAVVEIWGADRSLSAQALILDSTANISAASSTITTGSLGRTERLNDPTSAVLLLDAEADLNPFNNKAHLRIGFQLDGWSNATLAAVRLIGKGSVDLWVDTPATENEVITFSTEHLKEEQILGDTQHTISDISTAPAALSVSAYTSRTHYFDHNGIRTNVAGTVGELTDFTSKGPSLDPNHTGPKPELAAPGLIIVGARSREAPDTVMGGVSDLYRVGAGTSLSVPHVTGAAAILLEARPELAKAELKDLLLRSAAPETSSDQRWGSGKLDVTSALTLLVGQQEGCSCTALGRAKPVGVFRLGALRAYERSVP